MNRVYSCSQKHSHGKSIALKGTVLAMLIAIFMLGAPGIAHADLTSGSLAAQASTEAEPIAMQRLYNPNSGEHFYTASISEKNHLAAVGWSYEGLGWLAPPVGDDVYRLYNPYAGDHHYTLSASERDHLVSVGWRYEGVGWKSYKSDMPVYREYNPNAVTGTHNYTTSKGEHDYLLSLGWRGEGVGWYAVNPSSVGTIRWTVPTNQPDYVAKYDYGIYLIKTDCGDELYTNVHRAIYIKTENPNPRSIGLYCNNYDVYGYNCRSYMDVEYTHYAEDDSTYRYDLYRVPGGYIADIVLRNAGTQTIELREYRSSRRDTQPWTSEPSTAKIGTDYALIGTCNVTVKDSEAAREEWFIEVMSDLDDSMTPPEKMSVAMRNIGKMGGFKYLTMDESRRLRTYAKHPSSPWYISKRWDSYTSPAVLTELANRIGGFDEVHNCYGDYPRGSSGWQSTHYYCKATYNGQDYWYQSCPSESTGVIPDSDVVDFQDESQFIRLI